MHPPHDSNEHPYIHFDVHPVDQPDLDDFGETPHPTPDPDDFDPCDTEDSPDDGRGFEPTHDPDRDDVDDGDDGDGRDVRDLADRDDPHLATSLSAHRKPDGTDCALADKLAHGFIRPPGTPDPHDDHHQSHPVREPGPDGIVHEGETGAEHLWNAYNHAGRPPNSPQEDALARHYLPYASQIGERFSARVGDNVDRDDIIQSGYLGLLEAIRTFDPTHASFKTYANRQIRWKISDSLRSADWLPRRRRAKVKLLLQALHEFQQKKILTPTDQQFATHTGLSIAEIRLAQEDYNNSTIHSLHDLTGEADDDHAHRVADRTDTSPEDHAIDSALHAPLYDALKNLPARDQQMIALYYYGNHTLEEIGAVFDIGYSRVSQILKRATFLLRAGIETDPHHD